VIGLKILPHRMDLTMWLILEVARVPLERLELKVALNSLRITILLTHHSIDREHQATFPVPHPYQVLNAVNFPMVPRAGQRIVQNAEVLVPHGRVVVPFYIGILSIIQGGIKRQVTSKSFLPH